MQERGNRIHVLGTAGLAGASRAPWEPVAKTLSGGRLKRGFGQLSRPAAARRTAVRAPDVRTARIVPWGTRRGSGGYDDGSQRTRLAVATVLFSQTCPRSGL